MMCLCCSLALRDIFPTPVARYSLFVLEVPLNTNKQNQTITGFYRLEFNGVIVRVLPKSRKVPVR